MTNETLGSEGATATLGAVLKALGGECRIPMSVLEAGFEDGDYVDLSQDETNGDVIVSIKNNG